MNKKQSLFKSRILTATLTFILVGLCFSGPAFSARLVDKVLAIVNDDIITLSELEERKQKLIAEMSRMVNQSELKDRIDEVESQTLQMMIEEILIQQKAEEAGLRVTDAAVNDAIQNVITSNNLGSENQLEEALRSQGMTLSEYKEIVRKQLLIFRFQNSELKPKIRILDEEVRAAYDKNLDILKSPIKYHIQHILMQVADESVRAKVLREAQNVYKKLLSGDGFCELAEQYSDDPTGESCGDLGILSTQEMLPEFVTAVESLSKDSTITKPFLTKYGYHLVKVVEKTGGEPLSYSKVEEEIRDQLYQEKFIKKRAEWLEELKKTNYIKIIGEEND